MFLCEVYIKGLYFFAFTVGVQSGQMGKYSIKIHLLKFNCVAK